MSFKETLDRLFGSGESVRRRAFLTTAAVLSLAGVASGQHSIGVKLGINGNGNQQSASAGALLPTDLAGASGYAQLNWNVLGRWGDNSTNSFGTNAYAILDSAGDDTHVTIQWDAAGFWSIANGGAPVDQLDPNKNLMNAYDDSNGNGNVALTNALPNGLFGQNNNNKPLVYLTGLQAWLATEGATYYDVVVYMDGDNAGGRTGEYWLMNAAGPTTNLTFGADMTTHVFMRDYNNFPSNPTFQRVLYTSNNGRIAGAGNYTVFTGLSADSFVLRTSEFNTRCGINGVQIVPRTTAPGATIDPLLSAQTFNGGSARFNANVAGALPMTFQWQKGGVGLSDSGNISGASTASLKISPAGGGDAGLYALVVSNLSGMVTSAPAPLVVTTPTLGSYPEKVTTNGAVAYWRFNEIEDPSTNFSVAYDVVGGFNATYGQSAQNGYNGIAGPRPTDFPGFEADNSALYTFSNSATPLNYPSTYVNWAVAPPLNLNTNTVTISAWINPAPQVQGPACALLFERNGTEASGFGYGNNNNLGYTWNNLANTYGFVSGLVPASNQWSFVALVVSPTNAIIYLYNTNGQFSATNNVTHTNAFFAATTMIGDDPSSTGTPQGRAFTGAIDEVAVFNRCLSDQELYQFYKKGLNVGIIPASISSQPRPVALMEGRTAVFTTLAAGDRPLNYQWRTNNVNLVNGGRISGATSPTLTITGVTLADAANYQVVVDNIAHQPVASDPTPLTVIVSNTTPVAYEGVLRTLNPLRYWRLNEESGSLNAYDFWGGNIATNENLATAQPGPIPPDFAGLETTNTAYSFDGFSADVDTGLIGLMNNRAQFSILGWFNAGGTIGLRIGLFGQNDVCEYGFHGQDPYAPTGQGQLGIWTPSAAAYLSQTNITPGQWYFTAATGDGNNVNLYLFTTNGAGGFQVVQATSPGLTTNYGASAYSFKMGGAGVLDSTGNFFTGLLDEVAVFNRALSVGELSSLFAAGLGVGGLAPQVTTQPVGKAVYAGLPTSFTVAAIGSSPLAYQWRTNGVPIGNGGLITGATSNTLAIASLSPANEASYDVVITNIYGSVTSSVAVLSVVTPSTPYETSIIGLKPVAYYRLNETSGTVANEYYGGHTGTYGVAATKGIPGPQSPNFLGFEAGNTGINTFSNVPGSWVAAPFGSLSTNTATFTAWIQPTGGFDGYAGLVVNRNSGVAGGFGFTGGQLGYTWNNNNANTYNFRSLLVPPLSIWSFVALVVTPTNATIYMFNTNGTASAVNTLAHTSDVFGNNWQIGSDNSDNLDSGARTFSGLIDEVAIFNYSLTPAQLSQLYGVGTVGSPISVQASRTGTNTLVLTWTGSFPTYNIQTKTSLNDADWNNEFTTSAPFVVLDDTLAAKFIRIRGNAVGSASCTVTTCICNGGGTGQTTLVLEDGDQYIGCAMVTGSCVPVRLKCVGGTLTPF